MWFLSNWGPCPCTYHDRAISATCTNPTCTGQLVALLFLIESTARRLWWGNHWLWCVTLLADIVLLLTVIMMLRSHEIYKLPIEHSSCTLGPIVHIGNLVVDLRLLELLHHHHHLLLLRAGIVSSLNLSSWPHLLGTWDLLLWGASLYDVGFVRGRKWRIWHLPWFCWVLLWLLLLRHLLGGWLMEEGLIGLVVQGVPLLMRH